MDRSCRTCAYFHEGRDEDSHQCQSPTVQMILYIRGETPYLNKNHLSIGCEIHSVEVKRPPRWSPQDFVRDFEEAHGGRPDPAPVTRPQRAYTDPLPVQLSEQQVETNEIRRQPEVVQLALL
jgi:hypothetical protein